MNIKIGFWILLLLAVGCLILAIISFFVKANLLPIMFFLISMLMILNGLDVFKNKKQPKGMGYFYLGAVIFILITTFIKVVK